MSDQGDIKEDDSTNEEGAPADRKQLIVRLQVTGLIILLFILMTTSVVTVFMATGIIDISSGEEGAVSTMTDAQLICDSAIRTEHGDKVQAFALDDLSSHPDDQGGGYKMYYTMTVYRDATKDTGVNIFFVNCFVTAKGRISQLELFEEKSYVPKVRRRPGKGNAIGL